MSICLSSGELEVAFSPVVEGVVLVAILFADTTLKYFDVVTVGLKMLKTVKIYIENAKTAGFTKWCGLSHRKLTNIGGWCHLGRRTYVILLYV